MVRMPASMDDDDFLDGCEVDMADPGQVSDDAAVEILQMFADVWDDPAAVEQRQLDLEALNGV